MLCSLVFEPHAASAWVWRADASDECACCLHGAPSARRTRDEGPHQGLQGQRGPPPPRRVRGVHYVVPRKRAQF
eukprot:7390824-Prymnesium_polylepis.1